MPSVRIHLKIDGGGIAPKLQKVSQAMSTRIVKKAVKHGCEIVAAAAAAAAPMETGMLKMSIGQVVRDYPSHNVAGVVGPRYEFKAGRRKKGKAAKRIPALYAHLVEFGTAPHSLETSVDRTSINAGKGPWWSPQERMDWGIESANSLRTTKHGHVIKRPTAGLKELRDRGRRRAVAYFARRDDAAGKKVHPGARAHPFMGPAAASTEAQVQQAVQSDIEAGVNEAAT